MGNLVGGFIYWDFVREKEIAWLGSSFLDPEDIKSVILGAIWNFSKEQGSTELMSDYGAQRAR